MGVPTRSAPWAIPLAGSSRRPLEPRDRCFGRRRRRLHHSWTRGGGRRLGHRCRRRGRGDIGCGDFRGRRRCPLPLDSPSLTRTSISCLYPCCFVITAPLVLWGDDRVARVGGEKVLTVSPKKAEGDSAGAAARRRETDTRRRRAHRMRAPGARSEGDDESRLRVSHQPLQSNLKSQVRHLMQPFTFANCCDSPQRGQVVSSADGADRGGCVGRRLGGRSD
jgi:hypothetical protein